jgi:hypothetical protein
MIPVEQSELLPQAPSIIMNAASQAAQVAVPAVLNSHVVQSAITHASQVKTPPTSFTAVPAGQAV